MTAPHGAQVALDDIADVVERFTRAKHIQGNSAAEIRALEPLILKALGDAEVGTIHGQAVVTVRPVDRLKSRKLVAEHPELVERYSYQRRSLRIPRQERAEITEAVTL